MKDEQYMKGMWPTPKAGRLSFDDTAKILMNTSWAKEKDEVIAHALAITRRESAGDPLAYLAYLRVPGDPEGSKWQKRVYENNRTWLRSIPTSEEKKWNYIIPYWEFGKKLKSRRLYDLLPHRRIKFEQTKEGKDRIDAGLFQLNSQYFPILWDPEANAEQAYKIYKGWDNSFNAWATDDPAGLQPFMAPALSAVRRARGR